MRSVPGPLRSMLRWIMGFAWRQRRLLACATGILLLLGLVGWQLIPDYGADLTCYHAGARLYDRDDNLLRMTLGEGDVLCEPLPLSEMGPWTTQALIAAEDKRFHRHSGVDLAAICRAALQNIASGRVASCASTLSTLVVKLTEYRERTLLTKIIEAHHARQLEERESKESILEQYLNRAPFGANTQGIASASRFYFGRPPAALSLAEAALLVGLPQSPARLRPDRHHGRAVRRRNYVLRRMLACRMITREAYDAAVSQPVPVRRSPLPFLAPHFCDLLLERYPARRELRSTLDGRIQSIAEHAIIEAVTTLRQHDVSGGAVVILDVRTRSVLAMVGSPSFWDPASAGQVNAATARRSPGSTLKPFIYALALEQGTLTPDRTVADIPLNLSGYEPRNYDLQYRGPVPLREALVASLNIPAITCAREQGYLQVVDFLRRLGLSTLDAPVDSYGLSIALGTCEVNLLDLCSAYACLADGGFYQTTRFLKDETAGTPSRLLSPETAYMITHMLSGDERSMDLSGHMADVILPRLAWKTGTSTGHRDAWTIAYNPEYVVGVWLGNPQGHPSQALVGGTAAAPVAFRIFRQLYPGNDAPWFDRPPELHLREICTRSGSPPRDCCPDRTMGFYIKGITDNAPCAVHETIVMNGSPQLVERWPASVQAFLQASGMSAARPQLSNRSPAGRTLHITSPCNDTILHLHRDQPHRRQEIKLAARSPAEHDTLYWFVDGELLHRTPAGKPVFWALQKGKHLIQCTTQHGSNDRVTIVVE